MIQYQYTRISALVAVVLLTAAAPIARADAGDLLVSSRFSNNVLRYDPQTGEFKGVFAQGNGLANPNGIAIGPDRNLYVGLGDIGEVLRFNGRTGEFIDRFVYDDPATIEDETGGLTGCRGLVFGPDDNLYVNAGPADLVIRYDGRTGVLIDVFAEGQGLDGPVGIAFSPAGDLYVGAALTNAIYVYDIATRALLRTCSCPALMSAVTGIAFGPSGSLLAASGSSSRVVQIDPDTCECLGVFAQGGALSISIYMTLDSTGDLLVASFNNDSVVKFDGLTGEPRGVLVSSGLGGLNGTHDFAFVPEEPGDMNCDGRLDGGDIDPFFLALGDPAAYQLQFPNCDPLNGDMNGDGRLDGGDIDPFFACLGGGQCP